MEEDIKKIKDEIITRVMQLNDFQKLKLILTFILNLN